MKYLLLIFSLLTITISGNAFAFTPPLPTGYVTDTTGKLSADQVASLNLKIDAINKSTQNEIGVLLISSVGDENIEDITHDTFKAWRVGKAGLDNGVLVVVAVNSRKLRIQTGKGVEGDLPDLTCNDIINKMKPSLRNNDFAGAVNVAVDNISSTLESRKGHKVDGPAGAQFNQSQPAQNSRSSGCDVSGGLVGNLGWGPTIVIVFLGGLFILSLRKSSKKRALKKQNAGKEAAALLKAELEKLTVAHKAELDNLKSSHPDFVRDQVKEVIKLSKSVSEKPKYVKPTPTPVVYPAKVSSPPRPTPKPKKEKESKRSSDSSSSSSSSSDSSSSSSYDWSSGSSSSYDSGGGFGGGDSGGGGSSGDW